MNQEYGQSQLTLRYPLNLTMLAERMESIDESVVKLNELRETEKAKFVQDDSTEQYAARAALHIALQTLMDVVQHFLTRIPNGTQETYRDNIKKLVEKGVLDSDFAPVAEAMTGYRNRLIHHYSEVNGEELYDLLQKYIPDILEFKRQLAKFAEAHKNDQSFLMKDRGNQVYGKNA